MALALSLLPASLSAQERITAQPVSPLSVPSLIDIPANWSAGIYMIRVSDSKESWSGAVMIK
jgi:hypothetical protein